MSEQHARRQDWGGIMQRLRADPRSVLAASVLIGLAVLVTVVPMLLPHGAH